ncbi:MAG: response regulator [Deltaproteobacteria bacterium]|nr:response regulator [Deltaproteobacteria bacterium]
MAHFMLVCLPMGRIRSILVVDDDAPMREMVIVMLQEQGIEAVGAESADAAMEVLRGHGFDAVLTDMQMPGKTGMELLLETRALEPRTAVIVMTSFADAEAFDRFTQAGAFGCLSKPFSREDLQAALAGSGPIDFDPAR